MRSYGTLIKPILFKDSLHLLKGASTQAKKELFNEICEQENEKGIQLFIKRLPLTTLKQSFFKSLNERRLKTVALLSDSIQPHICEDLFTQAFKKNDFLLCRSLLSQVSSTTIHRLFYMVIKRRDKDKFLFLLPNVRSDKILLQTLSRAARKGSDQVVRSILPFISHEKLIETLEKFCFSLKIKGVKTLLPFINQVESQKLFPRLCAKGLEEVVTIFIESGLINSYKEGFLNACENEHVDLIALMQDLVDQSTINKAFLNGSLNGSEEIVALLSESVTVEVKQNGFLILCKEGNHSMVDYYLHTVPDALRIQGCCKAVMNGKYGVISLLLDGVEEEEIKKTIGSLTINEKERTRLLLFCLLKKLSPKGFSELFDHHPSLRLPLLQLGKPNLH